MRHLILLASSVAFLWVGTGFKAWSADRIRVVASTLDMADFTRQVGGDMVDVYAITKGQYDLHAYEPRPSEVMKLRKADLLIVAGMELDAFMPGLVDASRNRKIRYGEPGFVDPSVGVHALHVPTGKISGKHGDVHAYGNPHFWFSPENVAVAVRNITDGLVRVAPDHQELFEANRDAYLVKVAAVFEELTARMESFRGTKILQYHESWDYFCQTLGLELAGSVEPKPGIPPSAAHLAHLVEHIRTEQVPLLLVEPFYPEKPLRFLRSNTSIRTLRLHLFLCEADGHDTYLDNLTAMVDTIVAGLAKDGVHDRAD